MIPKTRCKRIPVAEASSSPPEKKRGPKPRAIIESPEPSSVVWSDRDLFHEALAMHVERHGDTPWHLYKAIADSNGCVGHRTIAHWIAGTKVPRSVASLETLKHIERRYRLPTGYFAAKLPATGQASSGHTKLGGMTAAERRRFAWHLPSDFDRRPLKEREEILDWVRRVIISGTTDYRRFQAMAIRERFGLRFSDTHLRMEPSDDPEGEECNGAGSEPVSAARNAPPGLAKEVAQLVQFKTATLTDVGYRRNGVWNDQTALQKIEHLSLLFGALASAPDGPVTGLGVPPGKLTMALLIFPAIWDWYVQWRERRRGFYTIWEVNMVQLALALARRETGWLRQRPDLAAHLKPIHGLLSAEEIDAARADWEGACDAFYQHGMARAKEIQRVAKVHRDPFEPVIAVLEADSPVGEYNRIADEVLRLMPNPRRYPKRAAEAVRSFLMIRLGLHLGIRQRNMRELLLCPRDAVPLSERQLEMRRRGELRWSNRDKGWEVLIPAAAFKNATSSFFESKPFRYVLPDLGDLYHYIDAYVRIHRAVLLGEADDPGTFFVKTVKFTSRNAAYDQNTFYEAWRLTIQRYGIYNPYTGRGAIQGLLPHGPHNVRDVLATHVLKETGSYEQAGYAIQDTADVVAKHYGRFLPENKVALAAKVINRVWMAA